MGFALADHRVAFSEKCHRISHYKLRNVLVEVEPAEGKQTKDERCWGKQVWPSERVSISLSASESGWAFPPLYSAHVPSVPLSLRAQISDSNRSGSGTRHTVPGTKLTSVNPGGDTPAIDMVGSTALHWVSGRFRPIPRTPKRILPCWKGRMRSHNQG